MNGGQGNNGGSDAPEASGGNQEINSGQTDNANSVTDTDKPASSLGFLAETSDSLGLPVRIALILFCASAIGLASLLLYVGRRRFNSLCGLAIPMQPIGYKRCASRNDAYWQKLFHALPASKQLWLINGQIVYQGLTAISSASLMTPA